MEDYLCDDMIVAIMRYLDPLSVVLFALTSKANSERGRRKGVSKMFSALSPGVIQAIEAAYANGLKPLRYVARAVKISVLCECYATPHVYRWAETVWPIREELAGRIMASEVIAIAAGNFELGLETIPTDVRQLVGTYWAAIIRGDVVTWRQILTLRLTPCDTDCAPVARLKELSRDRVDHSRLPFLGTATKTAKEYYYGNLGVYLSANIFYD